MYKIILASSSPRRQELLEQIGIEFTVCPAKGEEKTTSTQPSKVVEELSLLKAREVAESFDGEDAIVIGADTVVAFHGKIMGKPVDREDAARMLQKLSGNIHSVYTGVTAITIHREEQKVFTFSQETKVTFYDLSKKEIQEYIDSGEPMDKAGSYGIQGLGGKFVKEIHGDYNNVVGLPISHLYQEVLRNL